MPATGRHNQCQRLGQNETQSGQGTIFSIHKQTIHATISVFSGGRWWPNNANPSKGDVSGQKCNTIMLAQARTISRSESHRRSPPPVVNAGESKANGFWLPWAIVCMLLLWPHYWCYLLYGFRDQSVSQWLEGGKDTRHQQQHQGYTFQGKTKNASRLKQRTSELTQRRRASREMKPLRIGDGCLYRVSCWTVLNLVPWKSQQMTTSNQSKWTIDITWM